MITKEWVFYFDSHGVVEERFRESLQKRRHPRLQVVHVYQVLVELWISLGFFHRNFVDDNMNTSMTTVKDAHPKSLQVVHVYQVLVA